MNDTNSNNQKIKESKKQEVSESASEAKNISEAPEKQAEQQEIDYKDKYLRALADYQNLLKRVEKDKQDFVNYANARLIEKLLEIGDDFERAGKEIKHKGIELIYQKFLKLLSDEGVEKIAIGDTDTFNPEYMECIEAAPDGKKIEVVRNGYTLKGKVIRVARVKVV